MIVTDQMVKGRHNYRTKFCLLLAFLFLLFVTDYFTFNFFAVATRPELPTIAHLLHLQPRRDNVYVTGFNSEC